MAQGSETSVGTLVRSALDDVRDLIREEIALARAELKYEMSKATTAGVQFGIAGVALWFAATFLLVAVALGMAALFEWPAWAGFGVVAVVLAIAGVLFLSRGRRAIRTIEPLPRTVASVKENLR